MEISPEKEEKGENGAGKGKDHYNHEDSRQQQHKPPQTLL